MEATEQHFITPRTARYFRLGSDTPNRIWFVLHGYGQLANYFIRNFAPAAQANDLIIAPEGLSRFYIDGTFGRVGASWMTKEDRLHEIEDYLTYLNGVYQEMRTAFPDKNPEIYVLGFSQGCATAIRWVKNGKVPVDRLILWAGDLPPDASSVLEYVPAPRISIAFGNRDPYFSAERIKEQVAKFQSQAPEIHYFEFDGEHKIPQNAFEDFLQEISSRTEL